MPSSTWYEISVTLRTGNKEIESPSINSKEDADAALEHIRKAQRNGEWVELDWLSVNGGEILAANMTKRSSGIF